MKKLIYLIALVIFWQVSFGQKKVEWPNLSTIVDTSKMELKVGSHQIIVKYTNGKQITYDTIPLLIVGDTSKFAPLNHLPRADAGRDTSFAMGVTGKLSGKGIDIDGTIVKYHWAKVKGPKYGKVSYATRQTTTITGLVPGIYVFELMVTDDKGGEGRDQVTVTVN